MKNEIKRVKIFDVDEMKLISIIDESEKETAFELMEKKYNEVHYDIDGDICCSNDD